MVSLHQLLGFALVALVVIAIPGPSVVFTVSRAITYGRTTALLTVLGNSLGLLTALLLVAVGLGDLVATSDVVYEVLKYGGAAYLLWLGVQAIRHRRGIQVSGSDAGPPVLGMRALRQGYTVGFTNPKAYVIFAVLLPQFIDRSGGARATVQMLILGGVAFVIGLCCDSLWALAASRLREWFNSSPTRGRALGTVGGVSMIGLGLAVAAGGRPDA